MAPSNMRAVRKLNQIQPEDVSEKFIRSLTLSSDFEEEDDLRESGVGILEFSPEKAGMDVTPANFDFDTGKEEKKRNSGTLSSITGKNFTRGWNVILSMTAANNLAFYLIN